LRSSPPLPLPQVLFLKDSSLHYPKKNLRLLALTSVAAYAHELRRRGFACGRRPDTAWFLGAQAWAARERLLSFNIRSYAKVHCYSAIENPARHSMTPCPSHAA